MRKLSLVDDTFLRLESRRQPFHIGMLMLFEPPADAPPDFAANLAQRLLNSTKAVAPFNQRLVRRKGLHYWQEDEDFDLSHHFVHTSLPKPGRIRELLALVSRVHGSHLDRDYPLWRVYFVEGIEGGRIAVYLKIHHSVVDGVAGIRLLMRSMSPDAKTSAKMPPMWEIETHRSPSQSLPVPTPTADGLMALRQLGREGARAALAVMKAIRATLREVRNGNSDIALAGQAPKSLINRRISATRRFAAQQYSTPRMRAVAKALDATLNDVILAMCGGALRRYLRALNELPKQPLLAGVPISVRREGSNFGNEVAFTIAHLGTNIEDPVERLRAIKRCMDGNKQRIKDFSPAQTMAYAALMLMPGTAAKLIGAAPDRTLGNVVVSHVPGPREDIYWQGARLAGLYPASLLLDYLGLNITVISRHDYVDFGLIACRKTVPQVQRLLDYLEEELAALEGATGSRAPPTPPPEPATTKPRPRKPVAAAKKPSRRTEKK